MKYTAGIIFFTLIFGLTSCLKKIEGTDQLNTNIFDKDYLGDCWFELDTIYQYYNSFGFPIIRVKAVLPEKNMPELKPYIVYVSCHINSNSDVIFNAKNDGKGNYPFYLDVNPASSGEYCMTAGIYLEGQDTVINTFTLCGTL